MWLLRQRWLETERLGFPLLEVPRALIAGDLFGKRLFWWGALVPGALLGINGLHHYAPKVPEIVTGLDMAHFLLDDPWKAMAPFEVAVLLRLCPFVGGRGFSRAGGSVVQHVVFLSDHPRAIAGGSFPRAT